MSTSTNEAAQIAYEDRTGDTEPRPYRCTCTSCEGVRWQVRTWFGDEVYDDHDCPRCGCPGVTT